MTKTAGVLGRLVGTVGHVVHGGAQGDGGRLRAGNGHTPAIQFTTYIQVVSQLPIFWVDLLSSRK